MKIKFSFTKVVLFSFVFLSSFLYAQSQNAQLNGEVNDSRGIGISGATVSVKGTKIVLVTDKFGKFKLALPPNAKTIIVTHAGLKAQEISVAGKTSIEVIMREDMVGLDQVIVIGYGSQKKASVVGAISNVKGTDLVKSGIPSVANSLTGLVPGMVTVQQSGLPGAEDSKIYIRGLSSFSGNNQPLILVDGVERGLNDIDPNEVESISVLKDASATAVFGVKGGNGVILITTKRGQEGRLEIQASYDQTFKKPVNGSIQEDSYNTLKGRDELYRNQNRYNLVLGPGILNHYLTHDMPYIYPDVDAWKYSIKPFALDSRAAVSARGGTRNAKYFISIGYLHEGDLLKNIQTLYDASYKYDRLNYRMNFDFDFSKTTKVSISTGGYVGVQSAGGNVGNGDQANILNGMYTTPPYATPYIYPASILSQYPDPNNPVISDRVGLNLISNSITSIGRKNYKGTTRTVNDRIGTDLVLTQKLDAITQGLSFKALFSYNNDTWYTGGGYNYQSDAYSLTLVNNVPTWTRYIGAAVDNYTVVAPPYQQPLVLSTTNLPVYNYVFSGQFDYKRSFKKSNFGALALVQRRISQGGAGFKHYEENWVGRATYDYDGKYLLEASLAVSGSEQFAPSNRFGYFPSFAGGWNIAKEEFVKTLIPQMSNFKLRYSWGQTGNDNTGSQYLYISQYTNGTAYTTGAPGITSNVQTVVEGSVPNIYAQWERATKQDLGYELGFFNNKLTFSLDFFDEQRTGILMARRAVADWFGQSILPLNIGATKRHGYEFEAGYNGIYKKFTYFVKGNFNFNENRIVNQDDPLLTPDYLKKAGKPISANYAAKNLGYYQNVDEIANYSLRQNSLITVGADKLLDFNGDATTSNDAVASGNGSRPDKTFSFSAGLTYKKFDFSFMFQGATSVARNNGSYTNPLWTNDPGEMYIKTKGTDDLWTPININAAYGAWGAWNPGNKGIQNAKYIRLKTLELGYNLSGKILKAAGLSSARLALQGANLFTWAPGYKFGDPENEPSFDGLYNYALQFYPLPRRLTIALRANF